MVESMVERVARAIAMKNEGWTKNAKDYIPHARAAIEAMREPTEAMAEAAESPNDYRGTQYTTWRTMIDAALNEQVSG